MKNKLYLLIILLLLPITIISKEIVQKHYIVNEIVVSIDCPDSLCCYITLQHNMYSYLYKSTDQGDTWKEIYKSDPFNEGEPILINVEDGSSPHPDYCYMAMWEEGYLKKSSCGGKTFERIDLKDDYAITEIEMLDTNYGVAISNSGFIYLTFDGWKSFENNLIGAFIGNIGPSAIKSPVFKGVDTICFIGLVVDYKDSTLFGQGVWIWNHKEDIWSYSVFPETKWDTSGNPNPIFDYLNDMCFINDTLGFICGKKRLGVGDSANDIIYKTTNKGVNWEKIYDQPHTPRSGLQKISFKDELNGVAVGQFGKVLVTSDGGDSWEYLEIPEEMSSRIPPTMEVTWAGEYAIIGTYGAGFYRIEETIGVKDIFLNTEINIRQSPKKLFISIEDEHFRKYKLRICDILGNVVLEKELQSGIGTLYMPVDITRLINGAYLYMISTAGVVAKTGKVLIIDD
ncbi:WD40/YVTN/BNR-like repeat-containing protein [Bacteroidota bacterium]